MTTGKIGDQYYFESDDKKERLEVYMSEEAYEKLLVIINGQT